MLSESQRQHGNRPRVGSLGCRGLRDGSLRTIFFLGCSAVDEEEEDEEEEDEDGAGLPVCENLNFLDLK